MTTTLYRKYRPGKWSDVAGQNHIKVALGFEVEAERTAHAYLFSGPRGVGKTTVARILARAVNCLDRQGGGEPCGQCASCQALSEGSSLDVIEIDAASHTGVDNVRDNIIENSRFAPSKLKRKVFIIDEVHMLSIAAFNALLKTLEEPPEHVMFVLATTELHKVPATIASRCEQFDFRKIPFTEMVERLHSLSEREKIKVDSKAIEAIVRQSDGCLRDAESLLGKVMTVSDGKRVSYDQALVVLPRSDWQAAAGFVEALLRRDARTALLTLDDCLESGVELERFAEDAIDILRQLMMVKMGVSLEAVAAEADEEQAKRFEGWKELCTPQEVAQAAELLLEKRRDLKGAHPPQLPLELAVVKICTPGEVTDKSGEVTVSRPQAGSLSPAKNDAPAPPDVPAPSNVPAKAGTHPPDPPPTSKDAPTQEPSPKADTKPEPTKSAGEITLTKAQSVWQDFIRKAGEKSHSLTFLLGAAKLVEVKKNSLVVGFCYPFHMDKFNQAKPKQLMTEAIQALLGPAAGLEAVTIERPEEPSYDESVSLDSVNVSATPISEQPAVQADSSAPAQVPAPAMATATADGGPAKTEDGSFANPGVDTLAAAFGGQVVEG